MCGLQALSLELGLPCTQQRSGDKTCLRLKHNGVWQHLQHTDVVAVVTDYCFKLHCSLDKNTDVLILCTLYYHDNFDRLFVCRLIFWICGCPWYHH